MKTVKELRAEAKAMGIKGYSKMTKAELIEALTASEPKASEQDHPPFDCDCDLCMVGDQREPQQFIEEESSVFVDDFFGVEGDVMEVQVQPKKLIEFVKADNVSVLYNVNRESGTELVKVYWSQRDFKMHIWSRAKGDRFTSYASMITKFKKLKNGEHGDVARVVKSLKRIARKPALIVKLEHDAMVEAKRAASEAKPSERPTPTSKPSRGRVDADWLHEFVDAYIAEYGERPSGLVIKAAWEQYAM